MAAQQRRRKAASSAQEMEELNEQIRGDLAEVQELVTKIQSPARNSAATAAAAAAAGGGGGGGGWPAAAARAAEPAEAAAPGAAAAALAAPPVAATRSIGEIQAAIDSWAAESRAEPADSVAAEPTAFVPIPTVRVPQFLCKARA